MPGAKKYLLNCWNTLRAGVPVTGSESGKKVTGWPMLKKRPLRRCYGLLGMGNQRDGKSPLND